MRTHAVVQTPVGFVGLVAEGGAIIRVELAAPGPLAAPADPLLKRAAEELAAYFAGELTRFAVPHRFADEPTPFRKRVWAAIAAIPYGQTRTYGELARKLATSPRAVGGACRANPLPLLIPCHRVTAAHGLGGFAGERAGNGMMVDVKAALLELEKKGGKG